MPKRKNSRSFEEDINRYKNKIQKLERKIRERQISETNNTSESEEESYQEQNAGADTPALRPEDWILDYSEDEASKNLDTTGEPQPGPSTEITIEENTIDNSNKELDTEILEILGDDPSSTNKYGPEIRNDLANRLQHIVKEGLSKESRKNLTSKYLVPVNCAEIDAPKINLEIKAALTDSAIKRDKGIETKQKQMCRAITCLTEIINSELNSKTKNNEMLQKIKEVIKILCDLQYADSTTRRNFILFALKHNMKEHLKNTKIDTFLFGENLSETLKTAKAVNKSGVDLKADVNNKSVGTRYKGTALRPLNRKTPPQARRPPAGSASQVPRSRGPAGVRASYLPQQASHQHPVQGHSSRMSSQVHQAPYQRRRY